MPSARRKGMFNALLKVSGKNLSMVLPLGTWVQVTNLKKELEELLYNPQKIMQVKADYNELINLLTKGGHASANAAKIIYNFIK